MTLSDKPASRLKLDRIDRRILSDLQESGRMTNVDLAKLPEFLRRHACCVRNLEDIGLIKSYHAKVDSSAMGYPVTVFTLVKLVSLADGDLKNSKIRCRIGRWCVKPT